MLDLMFGNIKFGFYAEAQKQKFQSFLMDIGLSMSASISCSDALTEIDRKFLLKRTGFDSVYKISDRRKLSGIRSYLQNYTRNALKRYIHFLQVCEEERLVTERREAFCRYLQKIISESGARQYSRLLCSKRIIETMINSFDVSSVYCLTDELRLRQVETIFKATSINSHNEFSSAIKRYIEWLNTDEAKVFYPDDRQINIGDPLQAKDKEQRIAELEKLLQEKDTEISQLKTASRQTAVEHNQVVADVFSEIANRYLQCMKNKAVTRRKEVKDSLHSIMEELKMHPLIPEDLQKCINSFDDVAAPDIPHVNINEYVIEKKVGYQVDNVEAGGIGITVEGGKM